MSKFIITEWVIHPFDFAFTAKRNKPEDLKHKFRVLDDNENVYAYGYSDDNCSFAPLNHCKKYGCTKIQYEKERTKEYYTL